MPLNSFREIQRLSKARSARAEFLSSHSNYPEKEFIRKNSGFYSQAQGLPSKKRQRYFYGCAVGGTALPSYPDEQLFLSDRVRIESASHGCEYNKNRSVA